jgi:predicted nuclease with TOPRIM domain
VSEPSTISWVWWITVVEVPVLGCLFWLIHHGRRESERALLKLYSELQGNLNMVLENLSQSKLEVARLYATIADLKDVEKRLTDHLLRLESRLTYALSVQDLARCTCLHGPQRFGKRLQDGSHDA